MSLFDDPEPRSSQPSKPKDLSGMGIQELEDYIAGLREEIRRAEEVIAAKKGARQGAEAFFKS